MLEESKMEEVNKLRHKRRNKINNVNENIPGIADKVVEKDPQTNLVSKQSLF